MTTQTTNQIIVPEKIVKELMHIAYEEMKRRRIT